MRKGGRVAGRIRGLARTYGRARRRRDVKTLGKEMRKKGCCRKEPGEGAAEKAHQIQEAQKLQEMTLKEQQKGPVSSLIVPKEEEEGDWLLYSSRLKIKSRRPHHGTAERTPQDRRENTSGERRSVELAEGPKEEKQKKPPMTGGPPSCQNSPWKNCGGSTERNCRKGPQRKGKSTHPSKRQWRDRQDT